jgi:hypothetical protein
MRLSYFAMFLLAITVSVSLYAQKKSMPVMKASSLTVDIRDGAEFKKGNWTIMPNVKPDIYTTIVNGASKKITFYTDIDSMTFTVKPNERLNFIILVNGKDSALTQIYMPYYLGTLQKAGVFNKKDTRPLPAFTYQAASAEPLVQLRKAFNLDSIAGTGNEISKILNLLHWIHNLVPHAGDGMLPPVRNAMAMLAVCKQEKRGLNCRGLSTVLNECYLSLGFKSRFLTCLPKDSTDTECHVINMVFSETLQKWLWIDPTHDAYVMNEKGELLSVEEVRDRLVNNKPLILNPDANWNHKSSTVKEDYLYSYMAKNLYRFECPAASQYDTETKATGKSIDYIDFLPLDYYHQTPGKESSTNTVNKTTFVNYKTNNPVLFWAKPE